MTWLLSSALGLSVKAEERPIALEDWGGEFLPKNFGGFYLTIQLQGFGKNNPVTPISSNILLYLKERKRGKVYLVSQNLGLDASGQQKIWKIPEGDYLLQRVSFNDSAGITRFWLSQGKPMISIRHLFLSNLGELLLSPLQGRMLSIQFKPVADRFQHPAKSETFAAVIDGFSQKVQTKLGGVDLFERAKEQFSTAQEVRSAYSSVRQISMYYKVQLGQGRQYTKNVARTLATQELDYRTCYTDQLDRQSSANGYISFQFQISQRDGVMQNIRLHNASLRSKKMIECLYFALGKTQFPIKRKLSGLLSFYFNVKE